MSNLPKDLRDDLEKRFFIDSIKIKNCECSSDGSKKYLFVDSKENSFESVLLKMKDKKYDESGNITTSEKYTICVSTQIGCKVGCSFCLTAKGGFTRDLSAGEIVFQILAIKRDNDIPVEKRVNVVYMGMGEPLDNFENLLKAIKILSCEDGLSISPKRQTISTSGISPKITKLGEENLGVMLAISLHAVDDELRSELIPLNRAYNIKSIIEAIKKYPIDSRKRIMFEYLVIGEKNDDIKSAKKLIKLLEGIKSKVNLIYFNPYPGTEYKRPKKEDMLNFQQYLVDRGVLCTIRESKGLDISAACGQLRERSRDGIS